MEGKCTGWGGPLYLELFYYLLFNTEAQNKETSWRKKPTGKSYCRHRGHLVDLRCIFDPFVSLESLPACYEAILFVAALRIEFKYTEAAMMASLQP